MRDRVPGRAIAIIRNVSSTTNFVSPSTDGGTSTTEPWVDCELLPNIDGDNPPGPNISGVNRYGGMWEIQITDAHLWALGEFRYVNAQVRRAIARFPWTGDPTPPPPPVQPVLTELVTPSPLIVQPDRSELHHPLPRPARSVQRHGEARGGRQHPTRAPPFSLTPLGE